MSIYVHHNGQQLGPFTEEQLKAQLASGAISIQDHVWWDGQKDWVPLSQTPLGGLPPGAPVIPGTAAAAAYPVGVAAPTSQLAIWALVCGCASIVCSIFSAIPAIILGHMGLREIKKNPGIQGYGMALAGTILGYVFTAFGTLYLGVVVISVLIALGNQVKSINTAISPNQAITAPDSTTNSAPGK
jgi:hypothetical protein